MQESEPWVRREEESAQAYAAFTLYYQLPARERSLDRAWAAGLKQEPNRSKNLPGYWRDWSAKYSWVARALAYDDYRAEQDRREFEAERRRDKADRIRVLRAYRGRLTQVLAGLNPDIAEWKDITAGLKMVMEQLRSEYDEQPSHRLEMSGPKGGPIEHKSTTTHELDSATATTIFDILAAAGVFESAADVAKDDKIHTA
jgi:hypothetical protein